MQCATITGRQTRFWRANLDADRFRQTKSTLTAFVFPDLGSVPCPCRKLNRADN
jgi:hypothetical protein